jgi:Uma2 family endonuclease
MTDAVAPFRWTRDRYDQLVESGLIADTHIELIDGELVEIEVTHSPRHATAIVRVTEALRRAFPQHLIRVQLPIAVTDRDEPEPDVAVVAGTADDYQTHHPASADLVVEVSETSLRYDRLEKAALYARAGIPVYWILDLLSDVVLVHRDPVAGQYGQVDTRYRGEPLWASVTVEEVLPRQRP